MNKRYLNFRKTNDVDQTNCSLKNFKKIKEDLANPDIQDIEKVPDPPKEGTDTGIAQLLSDLIKDEWEAIDGYNSAIASIAAENIHLDMIDVLKDVVNEENNHIGMLTACLEKIAPNASSIHDGEEEGKDTLKK